MRYELCTPHHLRAAIAANTPLVMALGVQEYHGEHLPLGVDLLAVTRCLDRLEAEAPDRLILMPPFAYGAASHAVEGPEFFSLAVDAETILPLAKSLFTALLRAGFRNVHGIIHHQSENFTAGMPTDLAFKLAARQAIFAHLEATRGPGFWGRNDMRDYYAGHEQGDNPFNWIQIHKLYPEAALHHVPFDHAGEGETALMLALAPETGEPDRMAENHGWYTETAPRATRAQGDAAAEAILAHLRHLLGL